MCSWKLSFSQLLMQTVLNTGQRRDGSAKEDFFQQQNLWFDRLVVNINYQAGHGSDPETLQQQLLKSNGGDSPSMLN